MKYLAFTAITMLLVVAARWILPSSIDERTRYKLASIQRTTLCESISATGTLEPCDIIDVGAQVAGRIIELGIDPDTGKAIDYGSRVEEGMTLAKIDPSVYEIEVQIAEAQAKRMRAQALQAESFLQESQASLDRSRAELDLQQSKLDRAKRDWDRADSLAQANSISPAELDATRAELDSVKASLVVSKATIAQAECRIASQQAAIMAARAEEENAIAALKRARTTLAYCSIISPINGTIIDRRVHQGQTVVASLATPSLFLLASNLRELEIWVAVNEADIGRIRAGLPVRFTVDANPGTTYHGEVKQIRLNASMSQNVVTYTVVVRVQNSDGSLLPYLTANVEFIVEEHTNVLAVPIAATRFEPPQSAHAIYAKSMPSDSSNEDRRFVWIDEGMVLRQIEIQLGASEGGLTQILASNLSDGQKVVIGTNLDTPTTSTSNPFVPKMPGTKAKN